MCEGVARVLLLCLFLAMSIPIHASSLKIAEFTSLDVSVAPPFAALGAPRQAMKALRLSGEVSVIRCLSSHFLKQAAAH